MPPPPALSAEGRRWVGLGGGGEAAGARSAGDGGALASEPVSGNRAKAGEAIANGGELREEVTLLPTVVLAEMYQTVKKPQLLLADL